MIVFAYDGSLNDDWVAHYAVRFAAHTPERRLRLLHVHQGAPAAGIEPRLARIAEECAHQGVTLATELHAAGAMGVAERLLELVPADSRTTLVAGTRARPRNLAFLAGTVSARLFAAARFRVLAIRVVQPGLLGQPGRVLLPLPAPAQSAAHALPLLGLLGPDLRQLHLLLVHEVSRTRFRFMSARTARRLLAEERASASRLEEELRAGLAPHRFELDASAVVSDDLPKEILVFAGKLRSRLVCLGAPERTLAQRLAYGSPIEQVLRDAPCDVAVYRSTD